MDTKQSLEMQAKGEACPQCHNLSSKPSNRLVQDTCGHTKCRSCLLADDDYCQQCVSSLESNQVDVNGSNDHVTSTEVTDNHTAVICNGNTQQVNHEQTNEIYDETNLNGLVDLETNKTVLEDNEESKTSGSVVTPVREENEPKKSGSIVIPVHIRIQKDPVCYLCTICNKTFTTKGHIKYHQYCNGDLKPFKCETCDKEFVLKVQYQVHQWKHNNIKPFKCQICQKSFREKSKLSRHMTALHSSGKDYVCPHCGKCFKIKDSLRIHSLIHKNERPFACNICPATFNNSSNLKKHVATHSSEKAHMCDQCGRRFKLKWALSVHRRSHSNIRPHACNICPKTFVNLKDLQRHLLIHSDVKQFTCGICMTMFRRKDILRRHMKNTHPGKQGEIIKTSVKVSDIPKKSVVIDNPNAVNVITASPAITKCKADAVALPTPISTDSRPSGTVINGPIKLAFKTPAFKSHYNITRGGDFIPNAQFTKNLSLIGNTIDYHQSSGELARGQNVNSSQLSGTSELSTFSNTLHYETSFQNHKHALIKNIKFKVPAEYTFKASGQKHICNSDEHRDDIASVIVNNSNVSSTTCDVHWRRRTSQNLVLKN